MKTLKSIVISMAIAFSANVAATDAVNTIETKESVKNEIVKAKTDKDKLKVIYNSGKPLVLNNYLLDRKESVQYPGNLTAEEGALYVPQTPEFTDLYLSYIEKGMMPIEAVFSSHVSKEAIEILKKYKSQSN